MKKLLMINGFSIYEHNGTANTIHNIFDTDFEMNEFCISFHNKYTNLKSIYPDFFYSPLTYLLYKIRSCTKNTNYNYYRKNISGAASNKSLKTLIYSFLRAFTDSFPIHIHKKIIRKILSVNPDYLYTCGGSIKVLKTVYKIHKKTGIKVILHMMDNWTDTLYGNSVLLKCYRKKILSLVKRINRSFVNFAISQPLCDKMEKEFGGKYVVINNPCVFYNRVSLNSKYAKDKRVYKFLYAGTLTINRKTSMLELIKALYEYAINSSLSYVFDVYVPSDELLEGDILEFKKYNSFLHQYIPYDEIMIKYSECDALFLVESFDKTYTEYTKYSISTKAHEYMASKTAIFAYLPDCIYLSNYLKQIGSAIVANDSFDLDNKIPLLFNTSYCKKIGEIGYEYVLKNATIEVTRKKILEVLDNEIGK